MIDTLANKLWYQNNYLGYVLLPLAYCYRLINTLRRKWLTRYCQQTFNKPVIVVGNLSLGGAGKTPLVIDLVNYFHKQGLKAGVVSRGYKAKAKHYPAKVDTSKSAQLYGDEPFLIAMRTGQPVYISPNRSQAVLSLLANEDIDVVISDDGLQHYRMGRSIEIAVVDGVRRFGNGLIFPAGPLREGLKRLKEVDFIVVNSGKNHAGEYSMCVHVDGIYRLIDDEPLQRDLIEQPVIAIAGIGNPERFFTCLTDLGINFIPHRFSNHHDYKKSDFSCQQKIVIMTEKDAVKCRHFGYDHLYYVKVSSQCQPKFYAKLMEKLS